MHKHNRSIGSPISPYTRSIVLPVFVWFFLFSGCKNDVVMVPPADVNGSSTKRVEQAPNVYQLYQNYPNPFNPVTVIPFDISNDGLVTLTVSDSKDVTVLNLMNREFLRVGRYENLFDATNYATGIYLCTLIVESRAPTGEPGSVLYKSSMEMMLVK